MLSYLLCISLIVSVYSQTCLLSPRAVTHSPNNVTNDMEWIQIGPNTFHTTLVLDACSNTPSPSNVASFTSRCFNGTIPGPTLSMVPGNIYNVTIINALGPENANNAKKSFNELRSPNHTNLHTHGLHVSGMPGGDYVFSEIAPGEEYTYSYYIPCNHAGGTFFYHPHFHGSSTFQVTGGALGILDVPFNDTKEGLPDWYVNMEQILLGIYYMDLATLVQLDEDFIDDLFTYNDNGGTLETAYHLVNGEYQPTICMDADTWTMFRISYSHPDLAVEFSLDGCELQLLAKDGVLIHGGDNTVPREVDGLWFTTAGRADIAVYCPSGGTGITTYELKTVKTAETVAYIEVIGLDTTPTFPATTLTSFQPIRPDYLVDLTSYSGDMHQFGKKSYKFLELGDNHINNIRFQGEHKYSFAVNLNEVVEFHIEGMTGDEAHPFHMHVNHVQLISGGDGELDLPTNWHVAGDFLDTIHGDSVIRFVPKDYGGTVVMHCHILHHEDKGSMATYWIHGVCDAKDQPISSDSTCYIDSCVNNTQFTGTDPSISIISSGVRIRGSIIIVMLSIVIALVFY